MGYWLSWLPGRGINSHSTCNCDYSNSVKGYSGKKNIIGMRNTYIIALLFFVSFGAFGQNTTIPDTTKHVPKQDTINPNKGDIKGQLKEIKEAKVKLHSDSIGPNSIGNQPKKSSEVDTTVQNKYGDLLKDDTAYNKKYCFLIPFIEGIGDNTLLSIIDSKLLKYDWAQVSWASGKRNLNAGPPWSPKWDWDQTRFGNDFLGHPIFGNFYYNDARSNGYNFWASAPYALVGSYWWKMFGENIPPERNSLIATTVDGIVLGEILYRISSNILDDRTYGSERFFRELLAGIIDPMREFNRIVQGKTSRHTNKEVYQKEPLNITLFGGINKLNGTFNTIPKQPFNEIVNVQFDYGNPFEVRTRTPFDFFKLRLETDIGVGRKIIDNVIGYGNLAVTNDQWGKLAVLHGLFLNYDYWDKDIFELSTIGLGYGIFTKLPIGKSSFLYTNANIDIVPFAGASTGPVSDTSQSRDFNFGYGAQAKFETSLVLGKVATLGVAYYYFIIRAINDVGQDEPAVGSLGTTYNNILEPKITFALYKDLSIGFKYYLYTLTHNEAGYPNYSAVQSEEKIFLQFYFEDPQRRGHYN